MKKILFIIILIAMPFYCSRYSIANNKLVSASILDENLPNHEIGTIDLIDKEYNARLDENLSINELLSKNKDTYKELDKNLNKHIRKLEYQKALMNNLIKEKKN